MKHTLPFVFALFTSLPSFAAPIEVLAEESMAHVLKPMTGQTISVQVDGQTIQGTVKSVGKQFLQLEELAGRDFYDAIVRVDAIDAVIVRAR